MNEVKDYVNKSLKFYMIFCVVIVIFLNGDKG